MSPRDVHNTAIRLLDTTAMRLFNSFIGVAHYGFEGTNARVSVVAPNHTEFEGVPVYSARQYDHDGFLTPSNGVIHRHDQFIAVHLDDQLIQFQIKDPADGCWYLGMQCLLPAGVATWSPLLAHEDDRVEELVALD